MEEIKSVIDAVALLEKDPLDLPVPAMPYYLPDLLSAIAPGGKEIYANILGATLHDQAEELHLSLKRCNAYRHFNKIPRIPR